MLTADKPTKIPDATAFTVAVLTALQIFDDRLPQQGQQYLMVPSDIVPLAPRDRPPDHILGRTIMP
jgi:hypothetical protein